MAARGTTVTLPQPYLDISPLTPFRRRSLLFRLHSHGSQISTRLQICHAKIGGSVGEEGDDAIDEASFRGGEVMEEESDFEEDEDSESSFDLLFMFLQNMFKKVSKRARKACRSVLPDAISPQLVSFAVDGLLLLASLSILKALLEVVCTLGSAVFVAILLLRIIWSSISYFQSGGIGFGYSGTSYGRSQPVT